MLGNDEKKFLELRSKLFDELEELEKNIANLEERRDELTAILDGTYDVSPHNEEPIEVESVSEPMDPRDRTDTSLVDFIKMNPGSNRAEIDEFFEGWNLSSDDIRRSLERCKRRGLIATDGKGRGALWVAIK